MKKKYIVGIIVILIIIVDLFVLLYPSVSDYINAMNQSRVVTDYYDNIGTIPEEDLSKYLNAAREYNLSLLTNAARFSPTPEETAEYNSQLNSGAGVMGVLTIGRLEINLPIYHGTDAGVLQIGLGHLQGSSLPVGGIGTHSIVTGHSGLPSSKLLTDLQKMKQGDTFVINCMKQTITYRVDQIKTVEPHEVEQLGIDVNEDYCTLVTCTPYGINTHRLLVRGKRIDNAVAAAGVKWDYHSDARALSRVQVILLFLAPLTPVLIIFIIIKCRRIHQGGKTND